MADETPKTLNAWIAENSGVFVKLMTFTAALFGFPILTFFLTLHSWFEGNTTYAAIAAVVMANAIVALYVITALFEKPIEREKKE
ncbi:unnamed protein product [Rhizopus stolonifer]